MHREPSSYFSISKTHCRTLVLAGMSLLVASPALATPAHYLVFELDQVGVVHLVFSRRVELSASLESKTDDQMQKARGISLDGSRRPYVTFLLEDAAGKVVHQDFVKLPQWIRGEFHGVTRGDGSHEIDSVLIPQAKPTFVVRVPAVKGARLVIDSPMSATFNLDEVAALAGELPSAPAASRVQRRATTRSGAPANRVDLLIIGDGYTAAQQTLFDAEAAELEAAFFAVSPYLEYANFVNVDPLFVASTESGADHPPYDAACPGGLSCCSDLPALTDPLAGTYVDTAFDARFCANNIHRLLVVDASAIFAAASAMPDWDMIMVVVNDPTYGGSGGTLAVTSTHNLGPQVLRHEHGHSFTGLGDEYESPYPGYPACSDVIGPPCQPNVTDETTLGLIKWSPWISPTTPVPTPEGNPAYEYEVGLFEGARYQPTGMYRPRDYHCTMRSSGYPFGEVCRQEYVLTLYRGGWGVPATGIDLIEPGSEIPATAGVVDGTGGVTLSVALLQPDGSPPLQVVWYVDAVPQPPQTPPETFDFVPAGPGTYDIEIRVEDVTPFVHPLMSEDLLSTSRSWTVQAASAGGVGFVEGLRIERSSVTPGNLILAWTASCSAEASDYAVYEGAIGTYDSHTMKDCSDDDAALTEEIQSSAGNRYYLVIPLSAGDEGSYGKASDDVERPRGVAVCRASQATGGCPSLAPDLIIDSITHSPTNPSASDLITFTAVVRNVGSGFAGASTLSFRIGGELPTDPNALFSVPGLNPDDTSAFQRQEMLSAGNFINTAVADLFDDVVETDESNNQATDTYTVIGQQLIFEAESMSYDTDHWALGSDFDASGGGYIYPTTDVDVTVPPTPAPQAVATRTIEVTSADNYHVWLRMFGESGSMDRLYIGVNDPGALDNFDRVYPDTTNAYRWVEASTVYNLAPGLHDVNIAYGEPLARADRVVVVNDASCDPNNDPNTCGGIFNPAR